MQDNRTTKSADSTARSRGSQNDRAAQALRMSRELYSSSQATPTASCSVIWLSTDAVSMVLPSGTTPLEIAASSRTAQSRKTPGRHQRGGRSDALSTPAGLSMLTDPVASSSSLVSRSIPASAPSTSPTWRSKASGSSPRSPASSCTTPIIAAPRPRAFPGPISANRAVPQAPAPASAVAVGRPRAALRVADGWWPSGKDRDLSSRRVGKSQQVDPAWPPARSRSAAMRVWLFGQVCPEIGGSTCAGLHTVVDCLSWLQR